MSPLSAAAERFRRWVDAEDDVGSLSVFRSVFALVWLVYDAIDLAFGMTERSLDWYPHPRDPGLVVVQIVLLATGALLLSGRATWAAGMTAAAARATEALVYFPLNDFYLGSVFLLLIAHSAGGPSRADRHPRWVRDVLLAELAFVYLATAALKLNPDWLGGGHLFVRTQYLRVELGWPYPDWLERLFAVPASDAILAKLAVLLELCLAAVLAARRPYWLGVALVVAVHSFGTLVTNVWFLSATMIASVATVLPRRARSSARGCT